MLDVYNKTVAAIISFILPAADNGQMISITHLIGERNVPIPHMYPDVVLSILF